MDLHAGLAHWFDYRRSDPARDEVTGENKSLNDAVAYATVLDAIWAPISGVQTMLPGAWVPKFSDGSPFTMLFEGYLEDYANSGLAGAWLCACRDKGFPYKGWQVSKSKQDFDRLIFQFTGLGGQNEVVAEVSLPAHAAPEQERFTVIVSWDPTERRMALDSYVRDQHYHAEKTLDEGIANFTPHARCALGAGSWESLVNFSTRFRGMLIRSAFWTRALTNEEKTEAALVPSYAMIDGLVAIGSRAITAQVSAVDDVVITDKDFFTDPRWCKHAVYRAQPDAQGDWTARIPPGEYFIIYLANGCQPVIHGPYAFGISS